MEWYLLWRLFWLSCPIHHAQFTLKWHWYYTIYARCCVYKHAPDILDSYTLANAKITKTKNRSTMGELYHFKGIVSYGTRRQCWSSFALPKRVLDINTTLILLARDIWERPRCYEKWFNTALLLTIISNTKLATNYHELLFIYSAITPICIYSVYESQIVL